MATPVRMPRLGETVVEGTVARWLKQPGEPVEKQEPLLEISTDKIDTELPSPAAGVLLRIDVAAGVTVPAGTTLAWIGRALREEEGDLPAGAAGPAPATAVESAGALPGETLADGSARPHGRSFVSPVVARMAAEHGLDLAQIAGSGLGGRVTKKDVAAWLTQRLQAAAAIMPVADAYGADEVLEPLTTMRRLIAEHMVRSVQSSPHVTTVFEVDMTAVVRHREAHKAAYAARGIPLTLTAYLVAATATALRAVPRANSRFTGDGIVRAQRVHIGVAVALEDGLVVPVIRDADERTLAGLARTVADLAQRGRAGRLLPDELHGGTFTLTNHGTGGSLLATPIIHQPQSGILGVGAVVKRPVVRSAGPALLPSADDAIVIRPMCYLSFSFDHRLLDGVQADRFVTIVKEYLEQWNPAAEAL
jgi:2-oxoglutarate dehydrogenase E2 component (dihydrolipoamide succinyltransferase)